MREQVARLGMGLEDRLDTPIGLLSGGQRQALTVLMATIVRPSLLLLDEHTAALDPRSAELVMALTREVVAARRLTTLMVTHSMAQAVQLGDRVLVMHRGRIVHDLSGIRSGDCGRTTSSSCSTSSLGRPAGRIGGGDAAPGLRLGPDPLVDV